VSRKPLIAGNWKMNLAVDAGSDVARKLAAALTPDIHQHVDIAVFPPLPLLGAVRAVLAAEAPAVMCGAQDLSPQDSGAYTGDVSGAEHCTAQLDADLAQVPAEQLASVVIAYEPVWAIGTGRVASAADAQEVCGAIRQAVAAKHGDAVAAGVRVLYGGSVKADNVAEIVAQADIDGALVGGASLDADEFGALCRAAAPPR
jgi:triosephosphate isomerase